MVSNSGRKRSPLVLVLLVVLWSVAIGWGGAMAMGKGQDAIARSPQSLAAVPERLQLGLELYRDRCGSCHLAIPPEVFPSETWRQLLQNPDEHYGVRLQSMIRPELLLIWDYLSIASRPLQEDETAPYRFSSSRYFKILHPRVPLPTPISHLTCATCHPGAKDFDFRSLTPEWENSP